MPTYAVTGATGQLGRLVISDLLARGVPAGDIAAIVRSPGKAADLAAAGLDVRLADYAQPDALSAAFAGVDALLFISASEPGRRLHQHEVVVEAAQNAGLRRIVYTSIL